MADILRLRFPPREVEKPQDMQALHLAVDLLGAGARVIGASVEINKAIVKLANAVSDGEPTTAQLAGSLALVEIESAEQALAALRALLGTSGGGGAA